MKNNGFTIIELLAVMVILAIIALIATPIVVNIIEDSKMSAARISVDNYLRALNTTLLSNYTHEEEEITHICNISLRDNKSYIECDYLEEPVLIELKGSKPTGGIVEVVNNEVVEYEIEIDGRTIYSTKPTPSECFETKENVDGTLTITKYLCGNSSNNKILDVIIPKRINGKEITVIGSSAFREVGLTTVRIPEGIISIGGVAFEKNYLTKLEIPSTVTKIEGNAFARNKITSLKLPVTVVSIGRNAFNLNDLSEEEAFIYKRTGTSIDYTTLVTYGGRSRDVVIPGKNNGIQLTTIASSAFQESGITSVQIPDGVTTIGGYAFSENRLKEVIIPSTVTKIEGNAFARNKITSLKLPVTVVSIGRNAFNLNDLSEEEAFIYKRTGTSIDYTTLVTYGGRSRDVVIPSKTNGIQLTTIAGATFKETGITSVQIPDGVTTIGGDAFSENGLKEVIIPSTVTKIDGGAFRLNKLTSVTIKGKSSLTEFKNYPSTSPFGWASGYSDANIVFEP